MTENMFTNNTVSFGREPEGSVRIVKENPDTREIEADFVIEANNWVSAITAVAKNANTSDTHRLVKEIHFGKENTE